MAAWGNKPGAWAQDVEEDEQAKTVAAEEEEGDFPSLKAAAMAKPKKNAKSKKKLTLAEFTTGAYDGPGGKFKPSAFSEKGLTPDEMLMLPTGPRERTAEELERGGGLGGGFRSYGMRGGDRDREGGKESRRRDSGFDPDEPSRADSSSHWGSNKSSASSFGSSFGRGDRDRDRDSRDRDGPSKADETDDWGAGKKFTPAPSERRFGSGGGGFGDSSHSRADEAGNWGAQKQQGGRGFESYSGDSWSRRGGGGRSGFDFFQRDTAGGGPDGDRWSRRSGSPPAPAGGGGGRPRLNLQPRTAPMEPSSGENVSRSRATNPFGEARPREEVLKEKGQDWKKIDEDLYSRGRKNAPEGDFSPRSGFGSPHSNDKTEGDWRKRDNAEINQNSRSEESVAANGNGHAEAARNQSDESDDCEPIQTENGVEDLRNDSEKVHVSLENTNDNSRTARW
uniref:Uncharacterized protein n=1 Tax=Araucaria cunninghamii TaxID=56994 RepID=A0A0D6QRV3_ARACU